MRRLLFFVATACVAFFSACDSGPDADPKSKLVGTWQRQFEFQGAKARTIVTLGADRKFTEKLELVEPGGQMQRQDYAGEWSYDGNNFTRRYLQENGRQFSGGKMRFATLELKSVTSKEFLGRDNVGGVEYVFQRAESR